MNNNEREERIRRRMEKRKKELRLKCVIAALVVLTAVVVIAAAGTLLSGSKKKAQKGQGDGAGLSVMETETLTEGSTADEDNSGSGEAVEADGDNSAGNAEDDIIGQAKLLAAQYDYDRAMELLQSSDSYASDTAIQTLCTDIQKQKDACVPYPLDQITHIFFHSLIKDDAKAFDGDAKEAGYNQVMTTISEFNSMIQQMYDRGYVMVSVHDMCGVNEDGTVYQKEILLPPDKKAFVLSQDDVSYYHYMDGDGFAQKLFVDDHGEVKNTYIEDDGSISVGDYDMVPLIDTFVKEHPDFAYQGHKGIIALTGYEGVLGYRTDEVYRTREAGRVTDFQQKFLDEHPNFDWQADVDEAAKTAQAMKDNGWEFASHSWGHLNMTSCYFESLQKDTQRWLDNVAPIIGGSDVVIFPFGADISDWNPYTTANEKFDYLKSVGFNIFCNVDSGQYWVQFGDTYMRQGRRNLDGYRMYYNPEEISDLFDVSQAWDDARPTPVPPM